MTVVPHTPVRRGVMLAVLTLLGLAAVFAGYLLGQRQSGLDRTYLGVLEDQKRAGEVEVAALKQRLVDGELVREIDQQAAATLRENIKTLRDDLGGLKEEVTFYKSLMAPSSLSKGLQIAEFEVFGGEAPDTYNYHLLLTQVADRRNWIRGDVRIDVIGRQDDRLEKGEHRLEIGERVLSLTDLTDIDTYPLKFRFRYFQDLSGLLALPVGFQPERVVVTVVQQGNRGNDLQQSFEWSVQQD
ncbi:MAG: hypothetical protein O7C67_03495 [Gammaproteobacteria bacterium]|nr:hypothetical protein [Gammaproteobacteria bacterium]